MNQQARGGGGGGQEADYGVIYLVILVLGVCMALYYFFHEDLVKFIFYFKYYELKILDFFVPGKHFAYLINWMDNQSNNLSKVTYGDVKQISTIVGDGLVWPFVTIGVVFTAILYFFHPDSNYKAIESMESLREKLKPFFPCVQVVSELDLVNQSIDEGPWAMALTPIEFAKKNKLLIRGEDDRVSVDRLKSRILFSEQLGPIWTSVDVLPDHQRALFAAFCLFVDYKRDEAEALLEQFSLSATKDSVVSGKLDYKGVDKLLAKYSDHPKVMEILSQHSYVMTVFSQLITQARTTGIVSASSFLWLKPIDRKLWYVLNNVGRKAVYVETGAVTAHWLAEIKLGYALKKPMVDRVADALEDAVSSRVVDAADIRERGSDEDIEIEGDVVDVSAKIENDKLD